MRTTDMTVSKEMSRGRLAAALGVEAPTDEEDWGLMVRREECSYAE